MRGQSSIEFITLIGFLFVVFIGFVIVVEQRIVDQHEINRRDQLEQLADFIEREFVLAEQVQSGFLREVNLPPTVAGTDYSLLIQNMDTLIINLSTPGNVYVRFLGMNVTIINFSANDFQPHILQLVRNNPRLITHRTASMLYIRKDCIFNSQRD